MSPLAVLAAMRPRAGAPGTIVVDGAPHLVPLLARELRRDGKPGAVREGGRLEHAAACLWVGEPDENKLRDATLARVPIVAVTEAEDIPYVLATDVVRVRPGHGFPMDEIAAALARRLGNRGPAVAAALPALRAAVVDELIAATARRNGLLAAGLFGPDADMPVLTLNQVRLVTAIAQSYGLETGRDRALEALGVVGAGYGLRAAGREALGRLPAAPWAVKGVLAAAGTKAVGKAARLACESAVRRGS